MSKGEPTVYLVTTKEREEGWFPFVHDDDDERIVEGLVDKVSE